MANHIHECARCLAFVCAIKHVGSVILHPERTPNAQLSLCRCHLLGSHLAEVPSCLLEPGALPRLLLPSLHYYVSVFRIEFNQARPPPGAFGRDKRGARAAEWIEHDVAVLGRVADRPLDQRDRLHRRVQIVFRGLVKEPDIALVAIVTPVVIGTPLPAVEDRFVLALVRSGRA